MKRSMESQKTSPETVSKRNKLETVFDITFNEYHEEVNSSLVDLFLSYGFTEAANKTVSKNGQDVSINGGPRNLCFLFTGQGSQYSGMGQMLYQTSPIFRKHFDHCCDILMTQYDIPLKSVIFGKEDAIQVHQVLYSQTGIFTVEYSLLKLWENFGIKPTYVLGHGVGELVAAVAAGFLCLNDAIKLVATRSKLVDELPNGRMLSVLCHYKKAKKILAGHNFKVDIAAMNSCEETVIAGDTQDIRRLEEICDWWKVSSYLLFSSHALHSFHMDSMLNEYQKVTETIDYSKLVKKDVIFVSSITGDAGRVGNLQLDSHYGTYQIRKPVNFVAALTRVKGLGVTDFLEVGPKPFLCNCLRKTLSTGTFIAIPSLKLLKNDWEMLLDALRKLHHLGYQINWEGVNIAFNYIKASSSPMKPNTHD